MLPTRNNLTCYKGTEVSQILGGVFQEPLQFYSNCNVISRSTFPYEHKDCSTDTDQVSLTTDKYLDTNICLPSPLDIAYGSRSIKWRPPTHLLLIQHSQYLTLFSHMFSQKWRCYRTERLMKSNSSSSQQYRSALCCEYYSTFSGAWSV